MNLSPLYGALAALLCFIPTLRAGDAALVAHAVVMLPSHGVSATVIHTQAGKSLLLGCAHGYRGNDRHKPMRFEFPAPLPGQPQRVGSRLLAVDYDLDLSLVELGAGPVAYVCPVAPRGAPHSRQVVSIGYDEMQQPPQMRPITWLEAHGPIWQTRERPWHGRSGGGLVDVGSGLLIGVCSGYSGPRDHREIRPGSHGIYVSHAAICDFLERHGWSCGVSGTLPQRPPSAPRPQTAPRLQSAPLPPPPFQCPR